MVRSNKPAENLDFFPLTVDYREKHYAVGRIPGNFFRRESRPSTMETITARLVDRAIRPMFPDGFQYEVQVHLTVLSMDQNTTHRRPLAYRRRGSAGHQRHSVQRPRCRCPHRARKR